jgi:ribonucleotide monophosphatase NagD (HAD superfamily)
MVFKIFLKHSRNIAVFRQPFRHFRCTKLKRKQGFSGVLCDIDGVLLRGRQLIPGARESIKTLYDQNIPVVFLTNQGLQLETDKAESLSEIFDIQVLNKVVWQAQACNLNTINYN